MLTSKEIEERYGRIYYTIKDTVDGHPCEIAYYSESGEMIGFWAYGHYEPESVYQGQKMPYFVKHKY